MIDIDRLIFSFFNLKIAEKYLPLIVEGVATTISLGLAVIFTGILVGLLLSLLRSQQIKFINFFIIILVDICRSLPPLVLIILFYFARPYVQISMSAFTSTWFALSLVLAAFSEEIFWAGILSIPKGQWEAARSTGLSSWRALMYVILPQALKLTVAPLTSRAIAITKGTALGSVVALHEVLNIASSSSSEAGNATPLIMGAFVYLIIFIPFVMFGRWVESHFSWKR